MTVISKPNSVTNKIAVEKVEVSPRASGNILVDAAAKNGKPGNPVKRKKVDADEIQDADGEVNATGNATAEDGAAKSAGGQDGQMLLAQAETGAAGAGGTGAAGTGAAGGGAAGAAAAGAGITAGMLGAIALGAVVVAVAIRAGDDSTPAPDTTDTTAPVIQAMTAQGSQVVLTYSEALDAVNAPTTGRFGVTVGGVANVVTLVTVSGSTVTLTLTDPIPTGSAVQVTYTDPTAGNDAAAIQDAAGNDALSFTTLVVSDGYIRGAQIYIDTNNNGVADASEKLTGVVTNANGNFILPTGSPVGTIIATGGVNIDTGIPNTLVLKTPAGSLIITPLTTLVQAYIVANAGTSVSQASAAVVTALGLPVGTNLTTYDPLAALAATQAALAATQAVLAVTPNDAAALTAQATALTAQATALAVQIAAVQVATLVTLAAAAPAGTTTAVAAANAVMTNLATQVGVSIASEVPVVIDLTNADVVILALGTASTATVSAITAATGAIDTATTLTAISLAQSVALDTVAPAAPTTALAPESETGSSATDRITNDTTPTVRVSFNITATDGTAAVVGNVVKVMSGETQVGTATLTTTNITDGYVDITVAPALATDGAHAFTATITDAKSLSATTATALTITLDTAAPAAATAAATAAAGPLINAAEAAAGVAVVATLAGTGALAGDTIELKLGGASFGTPLTHVLTAAEITAGSYTFTVAAGALGANGAKSLTTVVTDIAGNPGTASSPLSLMLDTVAPPTATITTAALTNVAAPTVSGTAEADATVTAVIAGATYTMTATGGNWSVNTATATPASGILALNANGNNSVSVTAVDAAGNATAAAASQTLVIDTAAPVFSSAATASFAEIGTGTVYAAAATDAHALTYTLTGGADANLFSMSNGVVTFNAAPNFEVKADSGADNVYNIIVTATDALGHTASRNVAITVTNVNERPTVVALNAPAEATLAVNQSLAGESIVGMFADEDAGTTLTYSATGLPAGVTLSLSGELGGAPTTVTGMNPASAVITASDGALTVSHSVAIHVVAAPVITGITADVTQAKIGTALTFTATVSELVTVDTTAGTPTLTLDVGGTAMTATYTGGTGTSSLTFTATTTAGNDATVTVTAINLNGGSVTGDLTDEPLVTATTGQVVSNFVVDNSDPSFTSAATASVAENQTAAYTAAVSDLTAVTYALGGTDASRFTIASGVVTFNALPNFEVPADLAGTGSTVSDNIYDITITATDALGHAASQNVAITVTNVNEAPTVVTQNADAQATLALNQPLNESIADMFADVDAGTTLTYSATGLPAGVTLSTSGVLGGAPTTVTGVNAATVVITASDGLLTVSHPMAIHVVAAPSLSSSLDGIDNFSVISNIVMTSSEAVTAVAGMYIHIINDGGTGFRGENTVNTQSILATNASLSSDGKTITFNPQYDLDFNNNYHIEVDAGAFRGVTSDQASVAVVGVGIGVPAADAAMNFSTVNPSATATAAASQMMNSGSDTINLGHAWWDAEGVGNAGNYQGGATASPTAVARDFTGGDYAIVLNSLATVGIQTNDCAVNVNNFASGDLIYVDNHGDNNVQRQADFNAGIIIDNGTAPTLLSFSASGSSTGNNGGELYVTVEGSTASFADTTALQLLLGGGVTPVIYQPILFG